MECRDCQRKIQPFLDDAMELDELGEFVKHVNTCARCYEELEIMFMLSSALQELDSDHVSSYNFQELLRKKLAVAVDNHKRMLNFRTIRLIILTMMDITVLIGVILQIIIWLI